jgi:hypothetical protein
MEPSFLIFEKKQQTPPEQQSIKALIMGNIAHLFHRLNWHVWGRVERSKKEVYCLRNLWTKQQLLSATLSISMTPRD